MKKSIAVCLVAAAALVSAGTVNAAIDTIEAVYVAVDAGGQQGISLNGNAHNGANGVMVFNTKNPLAR